ncbi:MAG TPA: type II secretion system F family protein [Actinomycetota bacterium]|nr:type II secretion system F family protein [Actinomycetota bacterium]
MRNRYPLAFAAICSFLIALAPHARAASGVQIRKVDATDFPNMSVTVSLQGDQAKDLRLEEDGHAITDLDVTSLTETGSSVDVVLAIDTSGSMKGQPLAAATAAALRFVTSLPPDIRVAVTTFSDHPEVLTSLASDHEAALAALGKLEAAGETSLYDAAAGATGMFSDPRRQRNVILLSDGADTVSRLDLKDAVGAAKRKGVSFFTVGLTSGETDAAALEKLATATGGRYAPAGAAHLSDVYSDLATQLSNQSVISYRSDKSDGGQTSITVTAGTESDGALYLAPKVEAPAPPVTPPRPVPPPAPLSGTWLVVALALCFLASFLFATMVMGARARSRRDRELARRVAASRSAATPDGDRDHHPSVVPESLIQATEKVAAAGVVAKIDRRLERAGKSWRPGEFIVAMVGAAFAGTAVGFLLTGTLLFALLLGAVAAAAPSVWLSIAIKRRANKLHGQLPDILMILAGSLRAGHSFLEALDMVAQEIGDPGAEEFGRVVAEIRLGRSLSAAMDALADRIGSEDFRWALLAVNIQREVGGNLAEVLDTVAETMRDRDGIRRQIQVLTAEGRLSVAILAGLPVGVALYLAWVNPDYLALLFNNGLGLLMTAVATCLLGLGVFWMRKVVKIDV